MKDTWKKAGFTGTYDISYNCSKECDFLVIYVGGSEQYQDLTSYSGLGTKILSVYSDIPTLGSSGHFISIWQGHGTSIEGSITNKSYSNQYVYVMILTTE